MDGIRRNVPFLGVSLPQQLKQKVGDHRQQSPNLISQPGTMFYPPNLGSQIVPLSTAKIHTKVMGMNIVVDMVNLQTSRPRTPLKPNVSARDHPTPYGTNLWCNTIYFTKNAEYKLTN